MVITLKSMCEAEDLRPSFPNNTSYPKRHASSNLDTQSCRHRPLPGSSALIPPLPGQASPLLELPTAHTLVTKHLSVANCTVPPIQFYVAICLFSNTSSMDFIIFVFSFLGVLEFLLSRLTLKLSETGIKEHWLKYSP